MHPGHLQRSGLAIPGQLSDSGHMSTTTRILALFVLFLAGCHDSHSHPETPAPKEPSPRTVTAFTDNAMLFLEHPQLVQGVPAGFLAHLSVLADGSPLRMGRVRLLVGQESVEVTSPKRDGLFVPVLTPGAKGQFPASLTVEAQGLRASFDLGVVTVHGSSAEAMTAAEAEESAEQPGEIPFLLEQQWKIGLRLEKATTGQLPNTTTIPAEIRHRPGSVIRITAPVTGVFQLSADRQGLAIGDRVDGNSVLGLVRPIVTLSDQAQRQALSVDQQARLREQSAAQAQARAALEYADNEWRRRTALLEKGLGTQQELDSIAAERTKARQALRQAEEAISELSQASIPQPEPHPLVVPVGGVVAALSATSGASVQAGEELVRIIDPLALELVGHVGPFTTVDPIALSQLAIRPLQAGSAILQLPAEALKIAPERNPVSRTLELRVDVGSSLEKGGLRAGDLAELKLIHVGNQTGMIIPRTALIRDQGLETVYVLLSGEAFEKRVVTVAGRDSTSAVVAAGLREGEWVVSSGANAVRLASMNPEGFGHGHAH